MKEGLISWTVNFILYPTVLLISSEEKARRYLKWIETKFPNTIL